MIQFLAGVAALLILGGIWWLVKTADRAGAFEDLREPEKNPQDIA